MYYSDYTFVLTPDGYKNISSLSSKDSVCNFMGQSSSVQKVRRVPNNQLDLIEIKRANWFRPFYCTRNAKILIITTSPNDKLLKVEWVKACELKPGMHLYCDFNVYKQLPKTFDIPLSLSPTMELGYLFGTYAMYGDIIDNIVHFRPPNELIPVIKDVISGLFNIKVDIKPDHIEIDNEIVLGFFKHFGSKRNRCIPTDFWSSQKDYCDGIYKALITTNEQGVTFFTPTTRHMFNVFLWVCGVLDVHFSCDSDVLVKGTLYTLIVNGMGDGISRGEITSVSPRNVSTHLWMIDADCKNIILDGLVMNIGS